MLLLTSPYGEVLLPQNFLGSSSRQAFQRDIHLVLLSRSQSPALTQRDGCAAFAWSPPCGSTVPAGLFQVSLQVDTALDDSGAALLQLLGTNDNSVPGTVTVSGRQVIFTSTQLLEPCSQYMVLFYGARLAGSKLSNTRACFMTSTVSSCRILVWQQGAEQISRLVCLDRRSSALLSELRTRVASAFACLPCQVSALAASRGPKRWSISTDTTVGGLQDGDQVEFVQLERSAAVSVAQREERTRLLGAPVMSSQEYRRRNWVSDESGYYAIAGKMSPEEETEALLQLIAAFGLGPDTVQITHSGNPDSSNNPVPHPPLPTQLEAEDFIPGSLISMAQEVGVESLPMSQVYQAGTDGAAGAIFAQ